MIEFPEKPNRLLVRQVNKAFPGGTVTPEGLNLFISLINSAYNEAEDDRTLYRHAEELSNRELEQANNELTFKNELLDSFNHGMAHDVQNHTSNITGLVNMLKKYAAKKDLAKIEEITAKLDGSSHQLTSIVSGFLYLSKTASSADEERYEINSDLLMQEIALETQYLQELRKVNLRYHFVLNGLVYSPHVLKIILVNLISNAIKYSKPGLPADVTVSVIHENESIALKVSDQGIGIDLEHAQKKLYNLFDRANKPQGKGFGVGLFLIKKIVDRNNGKISLESTPGVGTTVTIQLPINETTNK
jgi:signal transduction histidine kinase